MRGWRSSRVECKVGDRGKGGGEWMGAGGKKRKWYRKRRRGEAAGKVKLLGGG